MPGLGCWRSKAGCYFGLLRPGIDDNLDLFLRGGQVSKGLLDLRQPDDAGDHLPEGETRATYVISAGEGYAPPETLTARRGIQRQWFDVTEPLLAVGTPAEALPVLTDDRAPVEELMASLFLTRLGR